MWFLSSSQQSPFKWEPTICSIFLWHIFFAYTSPSRHPIQCLNLLQILHFECVCVSSSITPAALCVGAGARLSNSIRRMSSSYIHAFVVDSRQSTAVCTKYYDCQDFFGSRFQYVGKHTMCCCSSISITCYTHGWDKRVLLDILLLLLVKNFMNMFFSLWSRLTTMGPAM